MSDQEKKAKDGSSDENTKNSDENVNDSDEHANNDDSGDIILDEDALAEIAVKADGDGDAPPSEESAPILDPVQALEAECEELKDQSLRALAEVENMRRRTERELAQARKYGHSNFARDLISVVENLNRAVAVLPEDRATLDETMTNLVVGVEMISQEINAILEKHGIYVIDPMGEKFDYEKHQAMFEIPTNDAEPGTVMQVAQRGWMLHDRLLTPAMVGVSKAKDDDS